MGVLYYPEKILVIFQVVYQELTSGQKLACTQQKKVCLNIKNEIGDKAIIKLFCFQPTNIPQTTKVLLNGLLLPLKLTYFKTQCLCVLKTNTLKNVKLLLSFRPKNLKTLANTKCFLRKHLKIVETCVFIEFGNVFIFNVFI